jgi:hypothetical protein
MFEKHFKVKVSMGDGKPIDDIIPAKNGLAAQDVARERHPGARCIHILGISEIRPIRSASASTKRYKPLSDILIGGEDSLSRDDRIRTCLTMHKAGHNQKTIAEFIGVGSTTVHRWLKQYS